MARVVLALSLLVSTPALAQPMPASLNATPVAKALFERDWVLMNWALKFYDRDQDILLSVTEAQAAASEFRKIADGDGDGRVTPREFGEARRFILARY